MRRIVSCTLLAAALCLSTHAVVRALEFVIEFRQLTYLKASDVARELNQRFGVPPATQATKDGSRPGAGSPPPNPSRLFVDFDDRTNTVVFQGPADLQKQAVDLVEKLESDARASGAKPLTRPASSPASARGPATSRPLVTIPFAGDALAGEFDKRFGIWFVGEPLPSSVSIILPAQVTADEALGSLRRAFDRQSVYSLRAVPGPTDNKIFQIWSANSGPPPLRFGTDPADVAVSDDIVTQIFPVTPPYGWDARFRITDPSAKVTVLENHHCVLFTDSSANVHRMLESLVHLQPECTEHNVVEYRQLVFLSAPEVARDINRRQNLPPTVPEAAAQARASGSLYADADPRLNIVVLNGPPDDASWYVDQMNRKEDAVEKDFLARLSATHPPHTTPLAGAALFQELEARYGIWFVGAEQLPSQVTVTLPEMDPANYAVDRLRRALELGNTRYQFDDVARLPDCSIYVLRSAGEKPKNVFFGNDPDYIPLTDDLITQIIPLKNESVSFFLEDVKPFLSAEAKATVLESHHCILITDTSTKIHRLLEIQQKIANERSVQIPLDAVQLNYARAAPVARTLNIQFAPPPQPLAGPVFVSGTLYAYFDQNTNTVITSGPPDQMKAAHDLISQLESKAKQVATTPAASTVMGQQ